MDVIPVATVARGSSSVPTRESTLKAIINHTNVIVGNSPFGGGTSEIFCQWNMEREVRSFFWTVWEINDRSVSFGNLPLKKCRWE